MNRATKLKTTLLSLPEEKLLSLAIEMNCATSRGVFTVMEEVVQKSGV